MSRGCSLHDDDVEELESKLPRSKLAETAQGSVTCGSGESCAHGSCQTAVSGGAAQPAAALRCVKCQQPAQALSRQRGRLCAACLHSQVFASFRTGLRVGGVVQPGDHVLVAVSGGAGSAALLHFLAGMRTDPGARPQRSKLPFTLTVAHVDEGAAHGLAPAAAAVAAAAVHAAAEAAVDGSRDGATALAAGAAAGAPVRWECVPVEDVFEEEGTAEGRRRRLAALLESVGDPTGREDLIAHLRTRLLLRTAERLGCSRIARGDAAGRLAAHVVAAAAKGRGYSLPGDVHLVDARYGPGQPMFIYPMRDLASKEVALLGHFQRLPLVPPLAAQAAAGVLDEADAAGAAAGPGVAVAAGQQAGQQQQQPRRRRPSGLAGRLQQHRSINALSAQFVAGLQQHHSGTVPNILGTTAKLQAFPWNHPPELATPGADKRRRSRQQHLARLQEQEQQQQQEEGHQEGRQQHQQTSRDVAASLASRAVCEGGGAALVAPPCVLCPLCFAPLADDELPGSSSSSSSSSSSRGPPTCGGVPDPAPAGPAAAALPFCLSCQEQVLGVAASAATTAAAAGVAAGEAAAGLSSVVVDLLPPEVRREAGALARAGRQVEGSAGCVRLSPDELRQQIAEFLLE